MIGNKEPLSDLRDIKKMMEKSSRFISLSGWSGVAAGICALAGAYFAHKAIAGNGSLASAELYSDDQNRLTLQQILGSAFFIIAVLTFSTALVSAFIFTYLRSKKNNTAVWSVTSRRLIINVAIPLVAGAFYLLKLAETGNFGLLAPGCLIFYGLALVNGSKYTLGEIKYLGYIEIALGIISCWFVGLGLYFWAIGFGLMHIIYGAAMWYKYERNG